MLHGDDDAELLLRMFGDKVLRDLRVMAEIEREQSRGNSLAARKRFLQRSEHRAMTQESAGGDSWAVVRMPLDLAV
jgi:hypothetical protein